MGSDILCLRLLITSILLTISCSAKQEGNATGSSADIDQLWEDFKVDFAKFYGSESEEEMRKQIFMENLNKTQTLNDLYAKGQSTFTAGINQFHDMKQSEFGAKTTCILDPLFSFKNATTYSDNSTKFPRNIDWSEKGYVTPVKDQGLCRACWAFVTTGALEALNFGNTGRLVSLSEQQLIDCSREYGNKGCNGGGTRGSFFYLTDNGGINSEASYPYEGIDGTCRYQPNATAATCHGSASARGEIKLKAIVANVGPAASAIFISESLRMYNGGIYDDDNCTGNPGHAVLVVGYGTDPKTKKDYWRIKNSFGTTWGMDGYALIARNKEMCGIGFNLRYPFLISDECHSGETSREDS